MANIGVPGVSDAEQIGAGAFGRVYRAHQDSLDRTVAVKVLANVDLDEEATGRFEREGKAVGKLSGHPNIVAVYSQGATDDGQPYLMMEFCPGGSYGDRIRAEGGLTWNEATEVAVATAGALETAHRAGILHRDVKPDNILIDDYETPKLADFGIARVSKAADLTATGTLTGSPAHMPPELIMGATATAAGDVYSLASTTYAMITGRAAFVRDSDESIMPMLRRIGYEEPARLEQWGVPGPVADVIARAMAKDPAVRPQTCEEFGNLLNRARTQLGVPTAPMKVQGQQKAPTSDAPPDGPTAAPAADLGPAQYSPMSAPSAPSASSMIGWHPPSANPAPPSPHATHPLASFQQTSFRSTPPQPVQNQPAPYQPTPYQPAPHQPAPHQPEKKGRTSLYVTVGAVAVVLVLVVGLVFGLRGNETADAPDHGATGLLIDSGSVTGSWVPGNTVKMDITNTPCGTTEASYTRVEEQAYIAQGKTTPRWSTLGATAESAGDAQAGFDAWEKAFDSCSGSDAPDGLKALPLPELPCDCDQSAAWQYGATGGTVSRVVLVRQGSVLAGVILQTTPSATDSQELFDSLAREAGRRAGAVG